MFGSGGLLYAAGMPDPSTFDRTGTRRRARMSAVFYAVGVGLFAAASLWAWQSEDPTYGESAQFLASYGLTLLLLLGSVLWVLLFAPLPRLGRWLFAACFLLPVVATLVVVRDFEPDGDMELRTHFRWEETPAQRRARLPAPAAPSNLAARQAATTDLAADEWTVSATDYAEYRGPRRDGVLPAGGFDFTRRPVERWRVPVGGGFAGMAVVGPFLVTVEQIGPNEAVVCYDPDTGGERWRHTLGPTLEDSTGSGPRSTPAIAGRFVYVSGATGRLAKLDLRSGQPLWQVDALTRFGLPNVTWGTSGSPLVRDGVVYVNLGSAGSGGLTAFDAETGETLWRHESAPPDGTPEGEPRNSAGYSSPMFATIAGVSQLLLFDGEGLRSHDVQTGREFWFDRFGNEFLVNVAQPLVYEDGRVFTAGSYGMGGRMIRVTQDGDGTWSTEVLWKDRRTMRCKFTSPVAYKGHIYGLSEGVLECVAADTGERQWKAGRYRHGQLLLSGDTLVILSEDGHLVTVRASPGSHEELLNVPVFDTAKVWNPPTLAGGRLYLRSDAEMVALDGVDGAAEQ